MEKLSKLNIFLQFNMMFALELVLTLRYDQEGLLFSLERSDGTTWSVGSDHVGSPVALFDTADARLVKHIR